MIPANLIINADDFGIDPRVSLAILHCLEKGLINSLSVLPFNDALHADLLRSILLRYPGAGVGCHLALFTSPDFPDAPAQSFTLRDGPHYYRDFLRLYVKGQISIEMIYQKWKAQIISLAQYTGGMESISHLDSHQHIHLVPGIWEVIQALQEEFNIPRVRVSYESLRKSIGVKFPIGLAFQALAYMRFNSGAERVRIGDRRRLIGFITSTRFTMEENRPAIEAMLNQPNQFFELMVHPALPGPEIGPNKGYPLAEGQFQEVAELEKLQRLFLGSTLTDNG